MTRFLLHFLCFLTMGSAMSQNTNLSGYSYVVVPEQFEFLTAKDQYKLNSMARFYFEKSGFNAYLANLAPNANRCDGLFADVEEVSSFLGTKLQVVIKDCNDVEIYRSQEGTTKYKEHEKAYQDALRKAFTSVEALRVDQKDVVLLKDGKASITTKEPVQEMVRILPAKEMEIAKKTEKLLPEAKFSTYKHGEKSFLLRKTSDGYSFYEESPDAADGLLLMGKIIVMDDVVKYMDASGKVGDATFDTEGNLTIQDETTSTNYKLEN